MNEKLKSLVSESVINHRKDLNKSRKFPVLHETLQKIFGDHLNDINLIGLGSKMEIRSDKLQQSIQKWKRNMYKDIRRRNEQSYKKQKVYDNWLKKAINSTDARNGL